MQAVIFDLDGLMINSEDLSLKAYRQILAPYGKNLNKHDHHSLIGSDSQTSASHVVTMTGVPLSWQTLAKVHWERLIELIDVELTPRLGVIELINELVDRHYPLGVASNSPIEYVEHALKAIGVRTAFRCVVGYDQVAQGKPAPDVYLAVAACLGVAPAHCLALEDSPIGMRSALAADMRCVVIPNEHLRTADFTGAYRCYDSLDDLRTDLPSILNTVSRAY